MSRRFFLRSRTVAASLGTAFLAVVRFALDARTAEFVQNCLQANDQNELAANLDQVYKALMVALPLLAVAFRVEAGGLYTPRWMPGPNKN